MTEGILRIKLLIKSEEETLAAGELIGRFLRGQKAALELAGDIGAGKTTFTRGLVVGLGGEESEVSSPTFALENVYATPQNTVHHFDLYRLDEVGLMAEQLAEAMQGENSIVVVEWAGRLPADLLSDSKITLSFQRTADGENMRKLEITSDNPDLINHLSKAEDL